MTAMGTNIAVFEVVLQLFHFLRNIRGIPISFDSERQGKTDCREIYNEVYSSMPYQHCHCNSHHRDQSGGPPQRADLSIG